MFYDRQIDSFPLIWLSTLTYFKTNITSRAIIKGSLISTIAHASHIENIAALKHTHKHIALFIMHWHLKKKKQPTMCFFNVNVGDSEIWIGHVWILYDVLFRVTPECRSNGLFAERMRVCSNIKFLCTCCS